MSLLDEFTQGFANAIDDIRSKVVEQGWSGQQQNYGGSGGWADTKGVEAPEDVEMADIGTDTEPPPIEIPEADLMEMFTPPPEAEQGIEQGQDLEQDGMDR